MRRVAPLAPPGPPPRPNAGTLRLTDVGFGDGNLSDSGKGGDGGTGGTGGRGADGSFNLFGGNPGGDGGTGGRGGVGGAGGDAITIRNLGVISATTPIGDATVLAPGEGGFGGSGGQGGAGGEGGAIGGADGESGFSGNFGPNGSDGAARQLQNLDGGTGSLTFADTVVFLHPTATSADEGQAISFNINRLGSGMGDFIVSWTLTPGGGLGASDFVPGTALSGSVQFTSGGPDGRVVTLHTLRDGIPEGIETFSVVLTGITPIAPSGGTVAFGTSQIGGSLAEGGRGTINGTQQADDLPGTAGNDVITAIRGNDVVRGSAGSDYVDGGDGQDRVVYSLSRGDIRVEKGDGTASIAKPDGTDLLVNVERIEFAGGRIVFDIDSETRFEQRDGIPNYAYDEGYIYRLYDAAFARTPDEFGIRFWVESWNRDDLSARELAIAFVESPEYQVRYPNASDADYIRQLYENALRRQAEPEGLRYWLDAFQSGGLDRADMLAYFAESTENRQRNAENTDDGLFFLASDPFNADTLV